MPGTRSVPSVLGTSDTRDRWPQCGALPHRSSSGDHINQHHKGLSGNTRQAHNCAAQDSSHERFGAWPTRFRYQQLTVQSAGTSETMAGCYGFQPCVAFSSLTLRPFQAHVARTVPRQ